MKRLLLPPAVALAVLAVVGKLVTSLAPFESAFRLWGPVFMVFLVLWFVASVAWFCLVGSFAFQDAKANTSRRWSWVWSAYLWVSGLAMFLSCLPGAPSDTPGHEAELRSVGHLFPYLAGNALIGSLAYGVCGVLAQRRSQQRASVPTAPP